jgi:hypothetical protein
MLGTLFPELQEIILNEIPFSVARSLNKHYQKMANKIEWKKLTPIIITKDFMEKSLNKLPGEITFSITNGSNAVTTKKLVKIGNHIYKNEWSNLQLVTTTAQTIKEEILNTEWNYFDDDNIKPIGEVFLPHYVIINNCINEVKHPLIKSDNRYRIQKTILTIKNYYQKLQPYPFQATSFLEWIALYFKIYQTGCSDEKKLTLICNKISESY